MDDNIKLSRKYGYDVLINLFEDELKQFIKNEILLLNYPADWKNQIPTGIFSELVNLKNIDPNTSIDDFFDELNFSHLKDILIFSDNYKLAKSFVGPLPKDKFIYLMDELNIFRRKIAHAKASYDDSEFALTIAYVKKVCDGKKSKNIVDYIKKESYKNAKEIPNEFYEDYTVLNNLPFENYDLDGGFIGRTKEINEIKQLIESQEDRIISITGAGGVGKTAIALKVSYQFLESEPNPFFAMLWFSAKTNRLTEDGIVPLIPEIKSDDQLIKDMLNLLDPQSLKTFEESKIPTQYHKERLYKLFKENRCLIVIDNLETILRDEGLINFVKNIPRPSQVLITSRKGLGEIERRYELKDMDSKDAIQLFRVIARQRKMNDLLALKTISIDTLVKKVKCYPLLIKWSIGQVYLGRDVNSAFAQINIGDNDIAKFSFNDVFSLLSDNSKLVLFSMIVIGDKPVAKAALLLITQLDDDSISDSIRELINTSFMYTLTNDRNKSLTTEYAMLALTRGFVESKLNDNERIRNILSSRYHQVSIQIEEYEKTRSYFEQQQFSLGIKTYEEKLAYDYVKKAKFYMQNGNNKDADTLFNQAINVAPPTFLSLY